MPHKHDNSAASDKAKKQMAESKGMGHPAVTGVQPTEQDFRQAPVAHDAPDGPGEPPGLKNPGAAGTDSKVGAAGATGQMEVTSDAPARNVPPEYLDRP